MAFNHYRNIFLPLYEKLLNNVADEPCERELACYCTTIGKQYEQSTNRLMLVGRAINSYGISWNKKA